MSQPPDDHPQTDLSDVAAEPPEKSVEAEEQAVGPNEPDVGGTVSPDDAQ